MLRLMVVEAVVVLEKRWRDVWRHGGWVSWRGELRRMNTHVGVVLLKRRERCTAANAPVHERENIAGEC